MAAIHAYELEPVRAPFGAGSVPGLHLYGLTDENRLQDRAAMFSFRLKDLPPRSVAEQLAATGIYVWDGNYYVLTAT